MGKDLCVLTRLVVWACYAESSWKVQLTWLILGDVTEPKDGMVLILQVKSVDDWVVVSLTNSCMQQIEVTSLC